jgi:hypothetical protein
VIKNIEIPSEWAYGWAKDIGDKEVMRDRITESEWAYYWAGNIGDKEIMRDRVTESEWAYKWARNIGDRKIMCEKITESEWAYEWAKDIGDRKIMRDRVTESEWAYCWARDIGDKEIMRDRITGSKWACRWARFIGDRKIMRNRVTESEWAYCWALNVGDEKVMRGSRGPYPNGENSPAYCMSKYCQDRLRLLENVIPAQLPDTISIVELCTVLEQPGYIGLIPANIKFMVRTELNFAMHGMGHFTTLSPREQLATVVQAAEQYGPKIVSVVGTKRNKKFYNKIIRRLILEYKPSIIRDIDKKLVDGDLYNLAIRMDPELFWSDSQLYENHQTVRQYLMSLRNVLRTVGETEPRTTSGQNRSSSLKMKLRKLSKMISDVSKPIKTPDINYELLIGDGVGLEIEFIWKMADRWTGLILKHVLGNFVRTHDSDIKVPDKWVLTTDPTTGDMLELRTPIMKSEEHIKSLCRALNCLRILERAKHIEITDRCGLHVHRNADKYDYSELRMLEEFYFNNKNSIRFLVNPSRDSNRYCRTLTGNRYFDEHGEITEDELKALPIKELRGHKNAAVNILAKLYNNTVEFRHHESTFNEIEILSWIEFTAAVMEKFRSGRRSLFFIDLLNSLDLSDTAKKFYKAKAAKRHLLYRSNLEK